MLFGGQGCDKDYFGHVEGIHFFTVVGSFCQILNGEHECRQISRQQSWWLVMSR